MKFIKNFVKYNTLYKAKFFSNTLNKSLSIFKGDKTNFLIFSFIFLIITTLVFSYNNTIKKKRLEAVDSFISSNQTVLLKNYILNKLKSPYFEYDYIVKNNDTVESILKKFSVSQKEINIIITKIKKEKLSRISPNQKMKFVLKRTKDKKSMEVIKINYPISKTTFVNIDKSKNKLEVTKNVTELFKKDVVVQGAISNNLYSSAIEAGRNQIL